MSDVLARLTEAVGNTPLVRLASLERETPGVELWAKLEFFNPGGSVKDRAALRLVSDALADGRLAPSMTLIEATTGIAHAWIGAALGIPVALVMPSNTSAAHKRTARALGAELIFSDPNEQEEGALRRVRQLVEESPGRFFHAAPRAHDDGIGRELWAQTEGRITHFVASFDTSVVGAGSWLRRESPKIQVASVESLDISVDEGQAMAERLAKSEGLFVGPSGGVAAVGALRVARELVQAGETGVVVTLFPDRADRDLEPAEWDEQSPW